MALTKDDIYKLGYALGQQGAPASCNEYKEGSWQHRYFREGWLNGRASYDMRRGAAAAEAGVVKAPVSAFNGAGGVGCTLSPFPARMPHATREHLRRLNADALKTPDSSRALRLDNKITALYERYA